MLLISFTILINNALHKSYIRIKEKVMICNIRFHKSKYETHISQVLTGFKILEKEKLLKIKIDSDCYDFRKAGLYEHNSIVEVNLNGEILVYDMADGYQSIHRKDVFDSQLDRVTFYFKRSYDPNFHIDMRNKEKILPYGLNYYCTCKGNPYDHFKFDKISTPTQIFKNMREFVSYIHGTKKWLNMCNYKNFESHNQYSEYNILFLTRVWDSSDLSVENMLKFYPYFTKAEALNEYKKWKNSLDNATDERIQLVRKLKKEFGNRFIGGIENTEFAKKICTDIVIDDNLSNKKDFMSLLRKNFICITSTGLHNSIGWKTAEYVSNARAIISEPLYYELPGNFEENKNYLKYESPDECISRCYTLLDNIEYIHEIENNNYDYYKNYVSPDIIILNSLKHLNIFDK